MIKITHLITIALALFHNLNGAMYDNEQQLDCMSGDLSSQQASNGTFDCKKISDQLSNCTCGVDFIDCSYRNFYSIPNVFSNLSQQAHSISRFLFSGNKIKSIDYFNLDNLTEIKTFDLKKNEIEKINASLFNFHLGNTLEFLSLCGNNNLTDFFSIDANFTKLNYLELNYLKKPLVIKNGFFNKERFPELINLELNDAQLSYSNMPFDRLENLLHLRLDSNSLSELPCKSLVQMKNLTKLNLNKNLLSKQTQVDQNCFKDLTSLNVLYLSTNNLKEENLQWFDLSALNNLKTLDLSFNKFNQIPYDFLNGMESLSDLRITVNENLFTAPKKSQLKKGLDKVWPNLVNLDLSDSVINMLPNNSFALFSDEMTDLILSNCKINKIGSDAFSNLKNLIILDLSNNNLVELLKSSDNLIFDYKWLKGKINLEKNKFKCDQNIEWFDQLLSFNSQFNKNLTCLKNGTAIPIVEYLASTKPVLPENSFNLLGIVLLVLIVLVILTAITYVIRRKQVKQRQQQYRYRYFTERSQEDGFDTDNVPVYRDCTVSLRIKDNEDSVNMITDSSTAALTDQRDIIA